MKSPCDSCGKCKNPDAAYIKCKRWRGWFNFVWRMARRKGEYFASLSNAGNGEAAPEGQKHGQDTSLHESRESYCEEEKNEPGGATGAHKRRIGQYVDCQCCGKRFQLRAVNTIYCSDECRISARKRAREKAAAQRREEIGHRICPNCGKEFIPRDNAQKYCAKKCCDMANKAKKQKAGRKAEMGSWNEIVKQCYENHLSYGEMVRRGMLG